MNAMDNTIAGAFSGESAYNVPPKGSLSQTKGQKGNKCGIGQAERRNDELSFLYIYLERHSYIFVIGFCYSYVFRD